MSANSDPIEHSQARRFLDEINQHILHGEGEIVESHGKLSLVWTDPVTDQQRFLAVKPAGEEALIVNGRRYPATERGLKLGLKTCLIDMQLIKPS